LLVLKIYDWWVLGIPNRYVWKCLIIEVLLPFFRQHAAEFPHHDVMAPAIAVTVVASPVDSCRLMRLTN
jgi:hypothetical protein